MTKISSKVTLLIIAIILVDQILKIWIKTNMHYSEGFNMLGLSWAKIHFVENEGMAFGWKLDHQYGKLLLSLFRIVAIGFLGFYIKTLIKEKQPFKLIICFALIMAGAIGNMIDSAFYGLLFTESTPFQVAEWASKTGSSGYANFLYGKVVDMFYFPMIDTYLPDWVPFFGETRVQFFRPVFNIADVAISVGIFSFLLFNFDFLKNGKTIEKKEGGEEESTSEKDKEVSPPRD